MPDKIPGCSTHHRQGSYRFCEPNNKSSHTDEREVQRIVNGVCASPDGKKSSCEERPPERDHSARDHRWCGHEDESPEVSPVESNGPIDEITGSERYRGVCARQRLIVHSRVQAVFIVLKF